jgi:Zn-dependent peptidase ImmA (M78 family)
MPQVIYQERETMPKVPVNGRVLQWARQIRGLSIDDAATLLGVSTTELRAYESGSKLPLVGFLRRMSDKYQINFSSLLMPEPLPIKKPPTDYRVRGRQSLRLSIETIVAREDIQEALELFRDLRTATRGLIPKLNIGTARLNEKPEEVAARERKRFNVSIEEQRQWPGLGAARRRWRERIEECGVFTYMIPLPADELSGFSLIQDGLAAICVNDREPTDGAKIFTLFHEYCHLLLRRTGISDENSKNKVERFCNQFAASFLIPKTGLIAAIGDVETPLEFADADVKRLATRFRVSNRAMAFRLEETGLAPHGFYGRRTAPWDLPIERTPTADKQPSPLRIRIKRIGQLHASVVLRAVKRGAINSFDASELIGLNPATFPKIEAYLG